MYDLVIRGGTVVDGTGAPARRADVAVQGDRIVAVGQDLGAGDQEIDASGLLVTPGWVDIHSHYDGQATWDPYLTPSSWNGVTTVMMGNCGVGFAPVKPDERDFLIRLMEGVEDIPGSALSLGIQWDWESFPEYMDALERRSLVMDVGVQVPHGPVRAFVMGDRGARNEDATAEDVDAMAAIVKEGLRAGAFGFTSSRTLFHKAKDGDCVPGTFAPVEELLGICRSMGEVGHGSFAVASGALLGGTTSMEGGIPSEETELASLYRIAKETGRPVTYACVQNSHDPDQWRRCLKVSEEAAGEGVSLIPQVQARPAGLLLGIDGTMHPFNLCPTFQPYADLTPEARLAELAKPEVRAAILADSADYSGVAPSVRGINEAYGSMFRLGDPPDYEPKADQSLAAMAEREGRHPKELAYDALLEGDYLYLPAMNYVEGDMEVTREMMEHELALFGLNDGGAHCGFICDASTVTFLLTHWVRDRKRGDTLPLEWIVERQTRATAEFYGLHDRGVVAPGMLADLNVIDFEGLQLHKPKMVFDLPGNERRLLQDVDGYRFTIKSGQVTFKDGEATGALPGGLVRGPQTAVQAADSETELG
ncbi:MAG: amidohydrolase [Deltaproteobacteria bacterium]|nr:amidohydrolase [Deltaproteobacteria bacterium]